MDEIPQPSPEPYSVRETVRVYLGPDDPDIRFHDSICEVTDVSVDDLSSETERELDAYSYTLRDADTDQTLPVSFRHWDLVPVTQD